MLAHAADAGGGDADGGDDEERQGEARKEKKVQDQEGPLAVQVLNLIEVFLASCIS